MSLRPMSRRLGRLASAGAAALALVAMAADQACAVSIELRDVAADRIERQRRATEGNLPLPDTPDLARFGERLAEKGMKLGTPILIRIFKAESELEVWMQKESRYELFATYPICHWSGTLGPKLRSGDKQAPEGFYTVAQRQLHRIGRWPRSLNLGFPNVFDKVQSRTGSYILVHGGCSSVGCYAMTNTVIEEIYSLTEAAIHSGEEHVPVHVFPFRMTDKNIARHADSEWRDFWVNLKEGYDSFERTRRPPQVSVCQTRYHFKDAPEEVGESGPLGWCGGTAAAVQDLERLAKLAMLRPSSWQRPDLLSRLQRLSSHLKDLRDRNSALAFPPTRAIREAIMAPEPRGAPAPGRAAPSAKLASAHPSRPPPCSLERPSCRRYVELEQRRTRAVAAKDSRRTRTAARH